MADILLIFPPDKKVAAGNVRGALSAAGYSVTDHPVSNGSEIGARARGAGPALLIWSRSLASAAITEGWFAELRKLPNLLELSTDGIAPQEGDESRVILLSGWRGQPFHLGWQRVLSDVQRLGATSAGPRSTPVAAPAPAPAVAPAIPQAAAAHPTAEPPRAKTPARKSGLPVAAALAVVGSLAAATWIGTRSGDGPQSGSPAPAVAPSRAAAQPVAAPAVPAVAAPTAAEPFGEVAPVTSPRQPAVAARAEPAASVRSVSERPKAASRATVRASRAAAGTPVTKRYTKRGSRLMRRFCARSGRHTLECRVFLRSAAAKRS